MEVMHWRAACYSQMSITCKATCCQSRIILVLLLTAYQSWALVQCFCDVNDNHKILGICIIILNPKFIRINPSVTNFVTITITAGGIPGVNQAAVLDYKQVLNFVLSSASKTGVDFYADCLICRKYNTFTNSYTPKSHRV